MVCSAIERGFILHMTLMKQIEDPGVAVKVNPVPTLCAYVLSVLSVLYYSLCTYTVPARLTDRGGGGGGGAW